MHKTEFLSLRITQWFEESRLTHSKQLEIDYIREAITDSLFRTWTGWPLWQAQYNTEGNPGVGGVG